MANGSKEIGRIGQRRYGGIVYEEFLHELRGKKGIEVYREMSENDDVVGAILFAIEMLVRQCDWNVEPGGDTAKDKEAAGFVESCMNDMQDTWIDTISEILSFLTYGWSFHEIVYKRRIPSLASDNVNNPDWIGWLKIKDSSISYPVMQKEGDGEYYLHRDFDGNYSFYGTPFLDERCMPDSDNCIIYGHNINGRRMFGALHAYDSKEYYRKHPDIYFRAGEEKRKYQIVSVIHADTSFPAYSFTDVGNWEEYRDYAGMILSNSLYQTELGEQMEKERNEETAEQFFRKYQFLTLSTCRSWVGRNARLLVVAARGRQNAE